MVLTERQKKELNLAIFEYFSAEGSAFPLTIEALKAEADIDVTSLDLSKGILEKKWTSVVRLQRKVMELETKIESMQHQSMNGSLRPGSALPTGRHKGNTYYVQITYELMQDFALITQTHHPAHLTIGTYQEAPRSIR